MSTTGGVALRTRGLETPFRERVRHRTSHLPLKSRDLTKVPLEDSVVVHDAPASRIGPARAGWQASVDSYEDAIHSYVR